MVDDNRQLIFHGKIDRKDLTETSHDPIRGGSTYEWDVKEEKKTMKVVSSFSVRQANPSEVDNLVTTKLTEELSKNYKDCSQMQRLCLDVARQTENEAERRGIEMKRTSFEGTPDVLGCLESLYQSGKNDNQVLWWHKDGASPSYSNLDYDSATDLLTYLLECPWLRCDELEWAIVDYLIFWDSSGFNDQIEAAPHISKWSSKKLRAARVLLVDVATRMKQAYFTMRPCGVLSPYQIRDALLYAQRVGAAWHPSVLAILDRAVRRDPPVWMVPR